MVEVVVTAVLETVPERVVGSSPTWGTKLKKMKAIIAKNNLSVIGNNHKLVWNCKEDLKLFKELTMGQSCVVGYNTLSTLPNLKGRRLFLDKRGDELIDEKVDWCIGGKKTYEKYCHLFTELHISVIDNNSTGDTMFPNLQNLNKDCKIFFYYFSEN